jgi:cytochrome c oxidase assembly factor CtaG
LGLSHPGRILYLFLAMASMAFLGLALSGANHILYPTYEAIEGTAKAAADQRMGGALMWISGMILILPALALVMLDWMRVDEREARRMDARLSRAAHTDAGRAEATSLSDAQGTSSSRTHPLVKPGR